MSSRTAIQPDELTRRIEAALGAAYILRGELGAGMSRVFVAEERALGRRVVLKVLAGELAAVGARDRFCREILLCAQLQHPHIVPVLGAGELDGTPYFIMPFIDGESLRNRLERGGRIGLQEAQRILRDVAAALAHAHSHGVVHRDIKPENILLSGGIAIVADFGVAKALGGGGDGGDKAERDGGAGTADAAITSAGFSIGTPAYMAPEQAVGDPSTDHRADIYAFGVLAYELLAGRTPFGDRSTIATLRAHAVEPVPPLRDQRREVPPVLAELVERCLEKRPDDRPRTALEIIRVLESGAVRRAGAGRWGPVRRAARGVAVAGTAVLIAAAVWTAGITGSAAPDVSVAFEGVAAGDGDPTLAAIFAEVVREQTGTPFRLVPPTRGAAIAVVAGIETRPDGYAFSLRALDRPSGDLLVAVRETAPDRASAMAAMVRSHARFERWLREAL